MTVILDHTIVLSPDKLGSALFLGFILDRPYGGAFSRFAPVQLDDELCIDYADADSDEFERRTFTLLVGNTELQGIVERLDAEHVAYGSAPEQIGNRQLNTHDEGRSLFFRDPNGHTFELTTVAYKLRGPV
jgi:catechol 2,3-dioxygenase-like lactoylglutathione lyase family enzyme